MKHYRTLKSVKYMTSRVKRACASMNKCRDSQVEVSSSITWTSTTSSPISSEVADLLVVAAVVVVTTNSSTSTWVEEVPVEVLGNSIITRNSSRKSSQISLRTQTCLVSI